MRQFRYDINGLRGWAVLAVVLYHFNIPPFSAGFVGVDVFFVISGFLMTQIIVSSLEQNNFSLINFYMARVRRIFPALAGFCTVLLIFGVLFLPGGFLQKIGSEISYAITFTSNFKYAKILSGYFAAASQENWLLHTWSLGVEWQFYTILPILLIVCYSLLAHKTINHKSTLLCIYSFLILLSYGLCIFFSYESPTKTFFLLPTRMWEMLAGGLVFLLGNNNKYEQLQKPFYIIGCFLFIISTIFFNKHTLWPSTLTLVPVLGASLIIWANQNTFLTNNPILSWLGSRSYSIYLYHWPFTVCLYYLGKDNVLLYQINSILLSLLLAELSYRFIETPCRSEFSKLRIKQQIISALIIFIVVYGFAKLFRNDMIPTKPLLLPESYSIASVQYQNEIHNRNPRRKECFGKATTSSPSCVFGNNNVGVILTGDSHAEATITALGEVAQSFDTGAMLWAKSSTPTIFNYKRIDNPGDTSKLEFNNWIKNEITKHTSNIPIVLLGRLNSALHDIYFTRIPEGNDSLFYKEFEENFTNTVCYFAQNDRPVYIVRPIPEMGKKVPLTNFHNRITNNGELSEDFSISRKEYDARNKIIWKMQDNIAEQCNIKILDPTKYLCDQDKCYGSINGHSLYHDADHLSEYGNKFLKPMFEEVFK